MVVYVVFLHTIVSPHLSVVGIRGSNVGGCVDCTLYTACLFLTTSASEGFGSVGITVGRSREEMRMRRRLEVEWWGEEGGEEGVDGPGRL